jgi:hypothetical protein
MSKNRLHFLGGIILAGFVFVHLSNHALSLINIKTHIKVMELLRVVYRQPIFESVLLLTVFSQIFSGLRLFLVHRKKAVTFFEKLQIWSGLYLGIFLVIHLSAIMAGRYVQKVDTNIYFGVAGLNTFPFLLFFVPYYAIAILAFFGHLAAIHAKKMKYTLLGLNPLNQAKILLLVGAIVTSLIMYGLTNRFNGVEIPAIYRLVE